MAIGTLSVAMFGPIESILIGSHSLLRVFDQSEKGFRTMLAMTTWVMLHIRFVRNFELKILQWRLALSRTLKIDSSKQTRKQ